MGIVHAPLKDSFDTPTQTLPDQLVFIFDKGDLRISERRCFTLLREARVLLFETAKNRGLVDSDLLCHFTVEDISCLPAVPFALFHLLETFNEHWSPPFTHTVVQPTLTSFVSSFGKTSSVKDKRYSHLLLLVPPALVSRSAPSFNCPLPPPHLCVRPHHPVIFEPFINREVQLRAVVFD